MSKQFRKFAGPLRKASISYCILLFLLGTAAPMPSLGAAEELSNSALYEKALSDYHQGEFRTSFIYLKNILQSEPTHLPARVLLAKVLLKLGQAAVAEQELIIVLGMGADPGLVDIALAEAYLRQRKYEKLIRSAQPDRHGVSDAIKLHAMIGNAHLKLGNIQSAREQFQKTLVLDPNNGLGPLGLGLAEIADGNLLGSTHFLVSASEKAPDEPEVWFAMADVARQLGRLNEALAHYTKVVELAPWHIDARLAKATVLLALKRDQQALPDIEYVKGVIPQHPMAAYLIAITHFRAGDNQQAQKALEQATAAIRNQSMDTLRSSPESLLLAGIVSFSQGYVELAVQFFTEYHKIYPRHLGARKYLARLYLREKQARKALSMLEDDRKLDKTDLETLTLRGEAYLILDQVDKAAQLYEQALELYPASPLLHLRMAEIYLREGDYSHILESLNVAYASEDTKEKAGILLSLTYLKTNQPNKALETIRRITDAYPNNPASLTLLALIHLKQGDNALARTLFERVIALQPDNLEARLNLAKLDATEEQIQAARDTYTALLEDDPTSRGTLTALIALEVSENNPQKALQLQKRLASYYQDDLPIQVKLVERYINADQLEHALSTAREIIAKYPEDLNALQALGIAELAAGKRKEAQITFKHMSGRAFYSPGQLLKISRLQQQAGDLTGAYWSLLKALDEDDSLTQGIVALTQLELELGKLELAEKRINALKQEHPDEAIFAILDGDLKHRKKDYAGALQAYRNAHSMAPSPETARKNYWAHVRSADLPAALEFMRTWIDTAPDDWQSRKTLAEGLIVNKQFTESARHLEHLVDSGHATPPILNNLALVYDALGDARSLEIAREAYQADPGNAAMADSLGWLLVKRGDAREGLTLLREAEIRNYRNPNVRYHIAMALQQLGKSEEAGQYLDQLRKEHPDFADRIGIAAP